MSVRSLVLASQSPRRRQILFFAGFEFDILPSQISEIPDENLNLTQQIRQLAHDKVVACLKMRNPAKGQGVLLLGADTIVALGDQVLGKPKDENQARQFLMQLSGQTHVVLTGLSFYDVDTDVWAESVTETKIRFRRLSDDEIETYVRSGDPMDKAGGYGIQGAAAAFVDEIEGPFDNVVGLPMSAAVKILEENGWSVRRRQSEIHDGLRALEDKIQDACLRSNRRRADVKLIAVSKTKPVDCIVDAVLAGQMVFGENYAQEALAKRLAVNQTLKVLGLKKAVKWHFIGSLQSKKLKSIVGAFELIHSVDRASLVTEIEKRAAEKGVKQDILLQINLAREEGKSGVLPEDLNDIVCLASGQPHIRLRGLMALPPLFGSETAARAHFAEIFRVFDQTRSALPEHQRALFAELSMGTSYDFEAAIAEGATMIRVGTAIFGARS